MALKMIITDLDGTFYNKDLTFDKKKFNELYAKMKENNILFVVASGNQYYQLISFFDQRDEMIFVAENGGYIVDHNKELMSVEINKETYHQILNVIEQYPEIFINIVCGKKSAYANYEMSEKDFNILKNYYPVMERYEYLHDINDQIMKFALMTYEDKVDEVANELMKVVDDSLSVVDSGHGCIDIIVKGAHKGNALRKLMKIYDIKEEEMMAFGDARNDLEMLKLVKYGFVMKNGKQFLKDEIKRVTLYTNEEDGILKVIEEYFDNPTLFLEKYK